MSSHRVTDGPRSSASSAAPSWPPPPDSAARLPRPPPPRSRRPCRPPGPSPSSRPPRSCGSASSRTSRTPRRSWPSSAPVRDVPRQDGTKLDYTAFNAGPADIEAMKGGAIDIGYIGPYPSINGYTSKGARSCASFGSRPPAA